MIAKISLEAPSGIKSRNKFDDFMQSSLRHSSKDIDPCQRYHIQLALGRDEDKLRLINTVHMRNHTLNQHNFMLLLTIMHNLMLYNVIFHWVFTVICMESKSNFDIFRGSVTVV